MNVARILVALLVFVSLAVQAEEQTPEPAISPKPAPRAKGKRVREKEAEGTQAPNRFEADTVIKSKYELNGQSLEVDPD